jgi:NAD(P)-dependent dehydrogenase (short-subunit alcohol dehydrogenase family)
LARYDLDEKVILVTGGTSGIGRAAAEACAASGAQVVVAGTNSDRLAQVVRGIEENGGVAQALRLDVTRSKEIADAVAFIVDRFGRLDGAFNSAGISGPIDAPLVELDEAEWDRVIDVNLKGVWLSMKHEVAQLVKQGGGGSIVNASSVAGLVGTRVNTGYSASKHGVTGLTRSVALEYAEQGIRVNAICPGWIETPMTDPVATGRPDLLEKIIARYPLGRAGRPEETSGLVAWLLSDASTFVTGAAIPVDGGLTAQ